MSEFIGERHQWVLPYFSSSFHQLLLVLHGWFVRWEVSGRTAAILYLAASRICAKQHTASLCTSRQAFFSRYFINSSDTVKVCKNTRFNLSEGSDFRQIDNLSIAILAFLMRMLALLSKDEIFLQKYLRRHTNFSEFSLNLEMPPFWLKHMKIVLPEFTKRPMPLCGLLKANLCCNKRFV